ncbi:unnamed protein product, partial [Musa banksii]
AQPLHNCDGPLRTTARQPLHGCDDIASTTLASFPPTHGIPRGPSVSQGAEAMNEDTPSSVAIRLLPTLTVLVFQELSSLLCGV